MKQQRFPRCGIRKGVLFMNLWQAVSDGLCVICHHIRHLFPGDHDIRPKGKASAFTSVKLFFSAAVGWTARFVADTSHIPLERRKP